MAIFIKGKELCRRFFLEIAKPLLDTYHPSLSYSAGLIGYGSDVLGYDDEVSTDHMWGPRFYLFLRPEDIGQKEAVFQTFAKHFPYEYQGYSVNFTEPDPNDHGVQRAERIETGPVNPLVFFTTIDDFFTEQLGLSDFSCLQPSDWLAFSEHRLLSLVSASLFVDDLHLAERLAPLHYYPEEVRLYLIASNWDIIASEQAFMKRCGQCGDELGSVLVCARIAERLMRLCFLYRKTYAPYSKWFGTAFRRLELDGTLYHLLDTALHSQSLAQREEALVKAQAFVADLHNQSGVTEPVEYQIESYFSRDIQVIFADKFSEAIASRLTGTSLAKLPLIGSLSQVGGLSAISDDCRYRQNIRALYQPIRGNL